MNRSQLLARCVAAAAAATIIAGLSAIPAAARPHPGESIAPRFDERNCLLSRVDTQLVRCVVSSGNGDQIDRPLPSSSTRLRSVCRGSVPGAYRIEGGGERDSFVRPHEPKLMYD